MILQEIQEEGEIVIYRSPVGNAVLSVPCAKRNINYTAVRKNAENSPIEVEFSDGTLRTAFPTGAVIIVRVNCNLPA